VTVKVNQATVDQALDLIHYAFQFEVNEKNHRRVTNLMDNSTHYGSFDGDKLISQVIATPFKVQMFNQLFDMMGIGFVSSDPSYRGEGHINRLMEQFLIDCKEQGILLSYLAPFSYSFYRRYGYELTFERIAYRLSSQEWPDSPKVPGYVRKKEWSDAKADIATVYAASDKNKHGGVQREDWWYEYNNQIRRKPFFAIYYNEAGEAEGYLIYLIQNGILTCLEWTYLTANAYHALNRYLFSHKDSMSEFHYEVGYDKQSNFFIPPAPMMKATVRPEMMARIVDIEAFLKQYPLENLDQSFAIVIEEDKFAKWNEGIFELDATTKVVRKVASTDLPQVKVSIQRLTQLLFGYLPLKELQFFGYIDVPAEIVATIEKIVPNQVPILEDYF